MVLLNNLEIKKFLYLVLAILVAMMGLIGLASLGYDFPLLRWLIGFVFLTFIPGLLILRILKLHNLNSIEVLAYSVGLSIAFVMSTGALANFVLAQLGGSRPISTFPISATLIGFTAILGVVAYKRGRGPMPQLKLAPVHVLSPSLLLFVLLPLMAILGTLLVNYYQNNIMLPILILIIAAAIALAAFGKFIPRTMYPWAILMVSIALQYYRTLYTSFLIGYDLHSEYLAQELVLQNGYWNPARPENLNTSLSLVILSPIYSVILKMDSVLIFKTIYPLFFALVPLTLFHGYREQFGDKRAFLSVFFLISVILFFGAENRQQVAELFFALLVLLMVDRKMNQSQKSILAIIFLMQLPLSHYGLAYVAFLFFVIGWLLLRLSRTRLAQDWWRKQARRFGSPQANPGTMSSISEPLRSTGMLTGTLVSLYLVFTLAWYMYTSSGTMFYAIVTIPRHILGSVGELLNPMTKDALVGTATGADFFATTTLGRLFRVFQYTTQLFIVVGFISLPARLKDFKLRAEFITFMLVSAFVLLLTIVLPNFAVALDMTRFYHITLLILAPLCILGGEAIWQGVSWLFKSASSRSKPEKASALAPNANGNRTIYFGSLTLAVLIPYFLFNTGFVFEVTQSKPNAGIPISHTLSFETIDSPFLNYKDVQTARWLTENEGNAMPLYADVVANVIFNRRLLLNTRPIPSSGRVPSNAYIILRTRNTQQHEIAIARRSRFGFGYVMEEMSLSDLPILKERNSIYDNGGGQVWTP